MGTLLVLLVGFCIWRFYWGHHTRAARNKFERRVREAVDTLSPESLKFPATFVRGTDFIKQGRLRTYEELRDDGLLVFVGRGQPGRRDGGDYLPLAVRGRRVPPPLGRRPKLPLSPPKTQS